MSSFKRRTSSQQSLLLPGVRTLPGPIATPITSTGIPSLDDILGGGLPLSCSLLVLAPDPHSAYGDLVQKYFIAQGLACGQDLCIIDDDARGIVADCMWMPGNTPHVSSSTTKDEEEDNAVHHEEKIKIAWRYEQMKQFQTTVPLDQSDDNFCRVFDLTCRIPAPIIDAAQSSGQLVFRAVSAPNSEGPSTRRLLKEISQILETRKGAPGSNVMPLRISLPTLGSVQWGDIEPQEVCYFLHSLRTMLRHHPHACASLSLPSHLCSESWGGPGWIQKLAWLNDACISLSAFTANVSLSTMFPSHHGFVHIHSLPAPYMLLPPSDKFSTLRGLSSSGENNLAFKCMRKRLIFETLHLDLEGGVGERRTTPASNALALDDGGRAGDKSTSSSVAAASKSGAAALEVQVEPVLESVAKVTLAEEEKAEAGVTSLKRIKPKKKVAFTSDRPDLYDF